MAQIAGFDSTVVSAGLGTEARQQESAPDSTRVTPVADGEAQRPDRQQTAPEETASQFEGRVAFTAKFGPDETGFPLQLVRGADLEAAVTVNITALQSSPLSNSNNDVVIRAQETEQSISAPVQASDGQTSDGQADAASVETSSAAQSSTNTQASTTAQSGTSTTTTSDGGAAESSPGSVVDVQV
jgi:hypothetical protein